MGYLLENCDFPWQAISHDQMVPIQAESGLSGLLIFILLIDVADLTPNGGLSINKNVSTRISCC